MIATDSDALEADATLPARHEVRSHLRGSSLLLTGRFLAKGLNFAVQVLIVRLLSQADYGALAYALSIVVLVQAAVTLGLDRSITRFVAIYHEERRYDKLFGTVLMAIGTVVSLSAAAIALAYLFQGFLGESLVRDQRALVMLLVLIFLAPLEAIDHLVIGLFAVFASPGSIFFRKYLLGPGLKLALILLLFLGQPSAILVAAGYLAAEILAAAVGVALLVHFLYRQGVLAHFSLRAVQMPWWEVLAFTLPLLSSSLVHVVMHTMDVVVLQWFGSVEQVATLRAVQPLAMMNQLVMASFATLFMPMAARLFARKDYVGLNNLYWQTGVWMAVFSFPIFAVTFCLAQPITVLLYGARYEQSAPILAILSLGCYVNAATGLNGLTLKVYGRLRYVVAVNLLTVMLNLAAILLLIPAYGAIGAAIGTCLTLVAYNALRQWGLRRTAGIRVLEWRYVSVYLVIVLVAAGLWLVQTIAAPPAYVGLALAGAASLLVFWWNRGLLAAGHVFPELLRIPLLRRVLGPPPGKLYA